jgi:flagellar basal-body rod protein FlgG
MTDAGKMLTTSEGYPILDDTESEIIIDIDVASLKVSNNGELSYVDEEGVGVPLGQKIGLVKFENRQGLENMGGNLYAETTASGLPVPDEEIGDQSILQQKFLESSNVQIVEEMVKLIVAQRAYELNSKAIQSSDQMLQQANSLRG